MKFSCDKYLLQSACAIASKATASKSTIPALEGLLMTADVALTVTGYDLRKGIYTRMEADVEQSGSVVVGARFLSEMLRRLPNGIVSFSSDENLNIKVKCGRSEYAFIGISPSDFPEMPAVDEKNKISVPQGVLRSMIEQTLFAVATSDVRPIYTGTLFEIENDVLTLVSVDGYRLALRKETIEKGHMENCSFVVPGTALSDVAKICSGDEDEVSISVGTKHILFSIGDTVVVSRRLEGDFLNYRKSIPESFRYTVKAERAELIAAVDRVALIIGEKNGSPVRITFGDNGIECRCMTPLGKAEDVCLCEGSGEGMEIGFNDRYLTDALKAASSEKLDLCLNSPSSPCIVRSADGEDKYTYMILPVRLRSGE